MLVLCCDQGTHHHGITATLVRHRIYQKTLIIYLLNKMLAWRQTCRLQGGRMLWVLPTSLEQKPRSEDNKYFFSCDVSGFYFAWFFCRHFCLVYFVFDMLSILGSIQSLAEHLAITNLHRALPVMEKDTELAEECSRELKAVSQAEYRLKKSECLGVGFEIFMATLVLLEVPWSLIGVIAVVKLSQYKKRYIGAWTPEKIQAVAKLGVKAMPALIEDMCYSENMLRHRAETWILESKLALWMMEQNQKGISVPASLAVETYVSSWGMGPHLPRKANRLAKFWKPGKWTTWMARFRSRWGFEFAPCPRGPAISRDDLVKKVHWINMSKSRSVIKDLRCLALRSWFMVPKMGT